MKARLSSTIWLLIVWTAAAFSGVLMLAYSAGRDSGGHSLLNAASLPGGASGALLGAVAWRLRRSFR